MRLGWATKHQQRLAAARALNKLATSTTSSTSESCESKVGCLLLCEFALDASGSGESDGSCRIRYEGSLTAAAPLPQSADTTQQEATVSETPNVDRLDKNYSDESFWDKVIAVAKAAGREVIEKALLLYYALHDPEVPVWAKSVAAGALAYFIMPFDAIPDAIVPLGYSDDLGVNVAALTAIAVHVSEETKRKAADKVKEWFD